MAFGIGSELGEATTLAGPRQTWLAGSGDDTVTGGNGDDRVFGGRDADAIFGGNGDDILSGGTGDDEIRGGGGDDLVLGAGNLLSWGLDDAVGRDRLFGGDGNDTVMSSDGGRAFGGDGTDILVVNANIFFDDDTLALDFSGVGGASAATGLGRQQAGGFEAVHVRVGQAGDGSSLTGTSGGDLLALVGEQFSSDPGDVGLTIRGAQGEDTLVGGYPGRDRLYGGAGGDMILLSNGNDRVFGGQGADVFAKIVAPAASEIDPDIIADFEPGSDILYFDPTSVGGSARNVTNRLTSGADPVAADPGVGQFLYDTDDGRLFYDLNGSKAGGRRLVATLVDAPVISETDLVAEENDGLLQQFLDWAATARPLSFGAAGGNGMARAGTSGDDILTGADLDDRLFGNSGDDDVQGGLGRDLLQGNTGLDALFGGDGADSLEGGLGRDVLYGGAGDDWIFADPFGEFETGEPGDFAGGGEGNDEIFISPGDSAYGGAGTDRLTLSFNYNLIDTPTAPVVTLDFSKIGGFDLQDVGLAGTRAALFEHVTVNLRGIGAGSSLTMTDGDDVVFSSIGDPFPNTVGATVFAAGGNDWIVTSYENDSITGGSGEDTISSQGQGGRDTLRGGSGDDVFEFWNVGSDFGFPEVARIMDFAAEDVLLLVNPGISGLNPAQVLVTGVAPVATHPGLAQFLFDTATLRLFLDTNGSDSDGVVAIADLLGSSLAPTAAQLGHEF